MQNGSIRLYNNNSKLKGAGQKINFSPDEISEYVKCVDDPIYFVNTYCKIVTLDHGLQLFKLYPCQINKINIIHENRKVILMEGRQQGKTTTSAAYILWYTLFQRSKTVAILANKASAAREVLHRYKIMYENLPKWLQQGVITWNKGDIELENGSIVFTAATSASGIRGKSVNMLYVDETAIIPNNIAEQFFTSVYPTISAGSTTKILLSSTPLGYNHFWKFWNDAKSGVNGFVQLFIPYWEIPGRDEKWAEEQRKLLGDLKFNQEVLCNFLGSSLTLIRSDIIAQLSPSIPLLETEEGLTIYEKPNKNHIYTIIADTAKGVGKDYSAFTVIDVSEVPYKMVAKYRNNKISPLLYPSVIYKMAKEYSEAYILVEINSSEQVAHTLYEDYEYENLLAVTRDNGGQVISSGFAGKRYQMGVMTDKKVKRVGCTVFKNLLEEKKLLIPDSDVISEISTFIERKNTYMADDGYNDDLVMTLVLFGWLTTNSYFKDLSNINIRQAIFENRIKMIEEELTPFGFFNDGRDDGMVEKLELLR